MTEKKKSLFSWLDSTRLHSPDYAHLSAIQRDHIHKPGVMISELVAKGDRANCWDPVNRLFGASSAYLIGLALQAQDRQFIGLVFPALGSCYSPERG